MRHHRPLHKVLAMVLVGVAVGLAVAAMATGVQATVSGWIAAAVVYLGWTWSVIGRADGERTRALARIEDDARPIADALVLVASVASLGGAGWALHRAAHTAGSAVAVLTVSAVATVVVSWLVVNTRYTLRYAHLYYTPPEGGVDFAGTDQPTYVDFAYLAFTVGMTYQVADTGLLTPRFRRALLGQALLAYVFGAVIIAATINATATFVL